MIFSYVMFSMTVIHWGRGAIVVSALLAVTALGVSAKNKNLMLLETAVTSLRWSFRLRACTCTNLIVTIIRSESVRRGKILRDN